MMNHISSNICTQGRTARALRCFICACLVLLFAGIICGCSPQRKNAPVPKTKGELLLEIYEAAEKKQYATALQKIERYRVLDPASAIMAEMEHTIRFNQLTAVVEFYLRNHNFRGALNAVQRYEKDHGISKRTVAAKEQLLFFARLDQAMEDVCNARNAGNLEWALNELEKLRKERKLSPKTVNFIRKERSKLKYLRQYERDLTSEILCQESRLLADQNNDLRTAEILFTLVKAVHKDYAGLQVLEERFGGNR